MTNDEAASKKPETDPGETVKLLGDWVLVKIIAGGTTAFAAHLGEVVRTSHGPRPYGKGHSVLFDVDYATVFDHEGRDYAWVRQEDLIALVLEPAK